MATTASAIRTAAPGDVGRLADLATQLGYPSTPEELAERLARVAADDDARVLVAVDPTDRPVGWIQVGLKHDLVSPRSAVVMGLVVDDASRGTGIGAKLLAVAEAWAAERGCERMLVGTRVTRLQAHRFYVREGYALLKTSHFFEKPLP